MKQHSEKKTNKKLVNEYINGFLAFRRIGAKKVATVNITAIGNDLYMSSSLFKK